MVLHTGSITNSRRAATGAWKTRIAGIVEAKRSVIKDTAPCLARIAPLVEVGNDAAPECLGNERLPAKAVVHGEFRCGLPSIGGVQAKGPLAHVRLVWRRLHELTHLADEKVG